VERNFKLKIENKINEKKIIYIDNFLKKSNFQKMMEVGKNKFPLAIFVCRLNPKKTNKKMDTTADLMNKLLNRCKDKLAEKFPYLIDEEKNFKFSKINQGFNIPVKKEDFNDLMDLLKLANKEMIEIDNINFFIDISHVSPITGNSFTKTQFKNIPPDNDKETLKNIFSDFGNINDLYHKDGIWTVLFSSLNPTLPLMYHLHLETTPKSRWFDVGGALASFSGKTPCSNCRIRGHTKSSCPGDSLISMLKKEKQDIQQAKIIPKPSIKTKDQSSEDLLVTEETSEEDKSTPIKIISRNKEIINNTPNKIASNENNKGNSSRKKKKKKKK